MEKSATELQPRSHFLAEVLGLDNEPDDLVEREYRRITAKWAKKEAEAIAHIPDLCWSELFTRTKVAARKKDRECNLTLRYIRHLAATTKGCCAVTGKQFSLVSVKGAYRRPFAPSVDRIDCSKGYVVGNVRIVCVAVNVALSDWGDGVLYELAKSMSDKYATGRVPQIQIDDECKPNASKILKRHRLLIG